MCNLELDHSYENIKDGIRKGFTFNEKITKVIFVKNKIVLQITRREYETGLSLEMIKTLSKK